MKQTKLSFIATATGTTYAETALSQWKSAGASLDSLDSCRITDYYFNRAWNTKYATNSRRDRGNEMSKWKLTIVIDDTDADDGSNPISTAVSNLEYDGYKIVSWEEESNE